jgi:hypothetical protein
MPRKGLLIKKEIQRASMHIYTNQPKVSQTFSICQISLHVLDRSTRPPSYTVPRGRPPLTFSPTSRSVLTLLFYIGSLRILHFSRTCMMCGRREICLATFDQIPLWRVALGITLRMACPVHSSPPRW